MKSDRRETGTRFRLLSALLAVLTTGVLTLGWGGMAGAAPAPGHAISVSGGHTIVPGADVSEEGTVTSIMGNVWNIGDFTVRLDFYTRIDGSPTIGSRVRVEGWVLMDGTILALRIRNLPDSSGVNGSGG